MKLVDVRAAAAAARARKEHRAAMAVLYDEADARVVVFRMEPAQEVPPHRSPSTVALTVIDGEGELTGEGAPQRVAPGALGIYAPNELHGMRALDRTFVVLATITPRPGER